MQTAEAEKLVISRLYAADRNNLGEVPMDRACYKSSVRKMVIAELACVLTFASCFANAGFVRMESNGINSTAEDNGSGDFSSDLGVLVKYASIDLWNVNTVTGISKPIVGGSQQANMDLSSVNLASSGASEVLLVLFGDDGFSVNGPTQFKTSIGGTLQNADISWQACINAANVASCPGKAVPSGSFTGEGAFSEDNYFDAALSGDYFLGLMAVITPDSSAGGPVLVSFDYQITQVPIHAPIPATIWLIGLVLPVLGVLMRRRV